MSFKLEFKNQNSPNNSHRLLQKGKKKRQGSVYQGQKSRVPSSISGDPYPFVPERKPRESPTPWTYIWIYVLVYNTAITGIRHAMFPNKLTQSTLKNSGNTKGISIINGCSEAGSEKSTSGMSLQGTTNTNCQVTMVPKISLWHPLCANLSSLIS